MELFSAGKPAAFEELYRRYSKRLLHFCYRMLNHDEAKAQDVLQDVFLKIADQPFLFDTSRKFKPWIFMVTANACRKTYREKEWSDLDETNTNDFSLNEEIRIDNQEFKRALRSELNQLKPGHRAVFILRIQERLSIKEISEILEVNEGTVKSRIHYTLKLLAEKLEIYNPINQQ